MKKSAGIIPYIKVDGEFHFLLGLPGGPFYCNYNDKGEVVGYKEDKHKWSILKGGVDKSETKKEAALREFREESSFSLDDRKDDLIPLGFITYKNGKRIYAWGIEAFLDASKMYSNECEGDYKGKHYVFPEIVKYKYMTLEKCKYYCNKSQFELIERLHDSINI